MMTKIGADRSACGKKLSIGSFIGVPGLSLMKSKNSGKPQIKMMAAATTKPANHL